MVKQHSPFNQEQKFPESEIDAMDDFMQQLKKRGITHIQVDSNNLGNIVRWHDPMMKQMGITDLAQVHVRGHN